MFSRMGKSSQDGQVRVEVRMGKSSQDGQVRVEVRIMTNISDSDLDSDEAELMLQAEDYPAEDYPPDWPILLNIPPSAEVPSQPNTGTTSISPNTLPTAEGATATNGGTGTCAETGSVVASTTRQSPPPENTGILQNG